MNRLLLVRHGENPANLTKEFSYRRVDYSLTEKGKVQARQTGEHLARVKVDEIWTSPLRRAAETAEAIAAHHSCGVRVLEDLREVNVGDLEGMQPLDVAWEQYSAVMRQWMAGNADQRIPGGETRRELCSRFYRALDHITQGSDGRTIVVVAHGGIFTHGVAEHCGAADLKEFFSQENHNCSISTVDAVREPDLRLTLVEWASTTHLSGVAAEFVESVPPSARVSRL